jgi:hypothetical protein
MSGAVAHDAGHWQRETSPSAGSRSSSQRMFLRPNLDRPFVAARGLVA